MKIIILASSQDEVEEAYKIIRPYLPSTLIIFICTEGLSFLTATGLGFQPKRSFDYYDQTQSQDNFNTARRWAHEWYKIYGDVKIDGISLGETERLAARSYFSELIRCQNIAANILKKERPNLIITNPHLVFNQHRRWVHADFSVENWFLAALAKDRQIKIIPIGKSRRFPNDWISILTGLIRYLLNSRLVKISRPDILFFAHFHQLTNLVGVIFETRKAGFTSVTVTHTNNLSPKDKQNTGPIFSYQSFCRPWDYFKFLLVHLQGRRYFRKIMNNSHSQSFFYYHRYQFLNPLLLDKLKFLYYYELPTIALQSYQSQRILNFLSPRAIVMGASMDVTNQILVRQAQKRDIPTIAPEHGFLVTTDENEYWLGDIVPMWGKIPQRLAAKTGIKRNRLVITGNPNFDKYPRLGSINRQALRKSLGLKRTEVVILFLATAPEGSSRLFSLADQNKILTDLFLACRNWPDIKVIVRSHPSNSPKMPYAIAEKLNYQLTSPKELNLEELFIASDYVISQPSTVILESIINKKKTVCFKTYSYRGIHSSLYNSCLVIENFDNLYSKLTQTNWTKLRIKGEKMVNNYCGKLDQKASKRLVQVIGEAVK